MPPRAGRPKKLSARVERGVEKKMRGKRRRSSRVIERELKRQKVSDVSSKTVQRTVHRRGLHALKQRKTSRLSKAHKRGRLKFARTNIKKDWSNVVFSDEHKFKQFKGGNPRHNFVWAKSVGEVPGKEMERWGLTVDAWGGLSWQGKTDLVFCEDTLDAPAHQDILKNSLRKSGLETKRKDEDYNKTKRLATRQSPRRLGWSGMRLRWWKSGPPKAMTLTRSRTFGPSSTRDLRARSSQQRKE